MKIVINDLALFLIIVGCAGRIKKDENCITAKALRIKFG
jgi:hypothetical protein